MSKESDKVYWAMTLEERLREHQREMDLIAIMCAQRVLSSKAVYLDSRNGADGGADATILRMAVSILTQF